MGIENGEGIKNNGEVGGREKNTPGDFAAFVENSRGQSLEQQELRARMFDGVIRVFEIEKSQREATPKQLADAAWGSKERAVATPKVTIPDTWIPTLTGRGTIYFIDQEGKEVYGSSLEPDALLKGVLSNTYPTENRGSMDITYIDPYSQESRIFTMNPRIALNSLRLSAQGLGWTPGEVKSSIDEYVEKNDTQGENNPQHRHDGIYTLEGADELKEELWWQNQQ